GNSGGPGCYGYFGGAATVGDLCRAGAPPACACSPAISAGGGGGEGPRRLVGPPIAKRRGYGTRGGGVGGGQLRLRPFADPARTLRSGVPLQGSCIGGGRTCGGAAAGGRSGSSRRHSYCDLVQKEVRIRAGGRLCLADGSITSVCTGRVSLVPALAGAVLAVG